MNILIIDAQGGGIGPSAGIRPQAGRAPGHHHRRWVTNSTATAAMRKGRGDQSATGENAVIVGCRKADMIAGPIGIVIADALLENHPGHGPGGGPEPEPGRC